MEGTVTIVYDPSKGKLRAVAEDGGFVRFPSKLRTHEGVKYRVEDLARGAGGSWIARGTISPLTRCADPEPVPELTYRRRIRNADGWEKTVDTPIKAYDNWEMFTAAGNRRLKRLAQDFLDRARLAVANNESYEKRRRLCLKYHQSWDKLDRTKQFGEASDTAVRESVGAFHHRVAEAMGLDGDDLWDEYDNDERWYGWRYRDKK